MSTSGPGGSAQGVWSGMGHFSGIEDCLRMFTAVEVLDRGNMVGTGNLGINPPYDDA